MSRNTAAHEPGGNRRIDIYEDRDVAYWTRRWGITRAELTDAISKVGNAPDAVAAMLDRQGV